MNDDDRLINFKSKYTGKHEADTPEMTTRDAAFSFMQSCGIDPTPDAVGQLVEVFIPCLRIMSERPYDPDGSTWRAHGWRGCLWSAKGKMERLWFLAWRRGIIHEDSAADAINFLGFYLRSIHNDPPWGEWGPPGHREVEDPPFISGVTG